MPDGSVRGVVNVKRGRTWDVEEYRRKGEAREDAERAGLGSGNNKLSSESLAKLGVRVAGADAARPEGSGRAFLEPRAVQLNINQAVGSASAVRFSEDGRARAGFHCPVCDVTLPDSAAYLAHLNSVQHQRRLGFDMSVKRSSVESVRTMLRRCAQRKYGVLEASLSQKRAKSSASSKKVGDKEEREENNEMLKMMGFESFK